ncbi:DUF4267 domain-containing protein [Streptomyces sp. NBC_01381]|uniref:DUF4267 domain-containing protein n=1 Tax=Streptomyces sp. NBC_01381 TaxID=2903845 RepID=UPI002251E0BF|nr:DUF4267 domain-containing protein [Streptomyces sp. NBC_01381]MCX4672518.1 DUF4267 domain-containing protein [Streptomyces sp. NBC_01381]
MTMKRLATILAVLGGLFLLYIGALFLLAPQASAEGFGLPTWPQHQGEGILAAKGMRDTGFGLVILALLLAGQRKALGLAMAAMAVVPAGDMLIVLNEGGPAATAYGVHGLTAAAVAVTAGLLLRERPAAA